MNEELYFIENFESIHLFVLLLTKIYLFKNIIKIKKKYLVHSLYQVIQGLIYQDKKKNGDLAYKAKQILFSN